jgi:23S rRNA (cytosine1962-C5)-methyltransferase
MAKERASKSESGRTRKAPSFASSSPKQHKTPFAGTPRQEKPRKTSAKPAKHAARHAAQQAAERSAKRAAARTAKRATAKPEAQPATKPAAKLIAKPLPKFVAKPAAKPAPIPVTKAVARPSANTAPAAPAVTKPVALTEAKPVAKAAAKTAPKQAAAIASAGVDLGARISRRAADRLRQGYSWVYASDVEALSLHEGEPAPALLPVADNRGLLLGTALYSPTSQIALRMVARTALDEAAWLALFEERLRRAIARRKPLLDKNNDACRLVFSEADELPGLIIDQYGPLSIVQLVAKGLDNAEIRALVVRVLREEIAPKAIYERPDPRMRELEGLAAPATEALWPARTTAKSSVAEFHVNGLALQFDANSGQKTGAFLDQRANYAAVAEWAKRLGTTGRALDVCTYQGGFALHLARFCKQVTGIDASHASLEVAEKNLAANRAELTAEVDWVAADAFDLLRDWSDAKEVFDTIVLDPPAFAKTKRAVESALRGYKELNLRAIRMLRPGGLLATFSCSHHVSWADLEATVASAAADAGRRVRLVERRGPSPDHPVVFNLPESEYLKCLLLEVE